MRVAVKLCTFSEACAAVERDGYRGLEFVTGGRVRFTVWRGPGPGYYEFDLRPFSPTPTQATKPCWRPTNDV
jgi:hypothetical protein